MTGPSGEPIRSILFLCGRNAVRSPLAAALMGSMYRGWYVASAGVRPSEADPFAVAVAAEIGLDLSRHEPRLLAELDDFSFDLVVTLAPEAHHHVLQRARLDAVEVEYWPVPAPPAATEESRDQALAAYRALRDGIVRRLLRRFGPAKLAAPFLDGAGEEPEWPED
jgi:protein-tyrosine-phosphatase